MFALVFIAVGIEWTNHLAVSTCNDVHLCLATTELGGTTLAVALVVWVERSV